MTRSYADLPALMTLMTGDDKHGPSATSTLDVLWVLYDRVLRVTPQTAGDPGRDRFLLSKGHGPAAYYAAARSGRTHQAPEDVALIDTVPGFSVAVPGHPGEVAGLLRAGFGGLGAGSYYLRLSAAGNAAARPVSASLQVVLSGRRAVVVAVGPGP
jgi:transketolase